MRRNLLFIFAFTFLILISNCTVNKLVPASPVKTTLCFERTEISLEEWLAYYTWVLEHEGEVKASLTLPDSNAVETVVWEYIKNRPTEVIKYPFLQGKRTLKYFYKDCDEFSKATKIFSATYLCPILQLPVTGITYEQAIAFCKWKTKVANETNSGKVIESHIEYRLPTEKEWCDYARSLLLDKDLKNGYYDSITDVRTKKNKSLDVGCPNFNYKMINPCESYKGTISVRGYFPANDDAIYDVFGNVSEMTSTKGVAKGGNYTTYANQCHVDSIQLFKKPEKWLGLRCVVVITY